MLPNPLELRRFPARRKIKQTGLYTVFFCIFCIRPGRRPRHLFVHIMFLLRMSRLFRRLRPGPGLEIPCGLPQRSPGSHCRPLPLSPCPDFAERSSEESGEYRRCIAGPADAVQNARPSAARGTVRAPRWPRKEMV